MASTTSSAGILFTIPAKAISAAINALPAPTVFRLRNFDNQPLGHKLNLINSQSHSKASEDWRGVPPAASTAAAAAIAEAPAYFGLTSTNSTSNHRIVGCDHSKKER